MKIINKSLNGLSIAFLFLASSMFSMVQASTLVCFQTIDAPEGFNKITLNPQSLPTYFAKLNSELCFESTGINYKASVDEFGTVSYNELTIGLEYNLGNMDLHRLFIIPHPINIVYTTSSSDGGVIPVIVARLENAMASNISLSFSGENVYQVSSSHEISLSYKKLHIDAFNTDPFTGENKFASTYCFDAVKNTTCD